MTIGVKPPCELDDPLSASGLSALLISSYRVFFAVKWIGAAYLLYLGGRTILGHNQVLPSGELAEARASATRFFRDGFVLQMSNPKAVIFFWAISPQLIDPHRTVLPQIVILGLTSVNLRIWRVIRLWLGGSPGLGAGPATGLRQKDQPHRREPADWRRDGTGRAAAGLKTNASGSTATVFGAHQLLDVH